MSETKNDTEARAKREIAEEWAAYQADHHVSSSYYAEVKGDWAEEKLVAERVKNLELREREEKLQEVIEDLLKAWGDLRSDSPVSELWDELKELDHEWRTFRMGF